jgi:hypothetical protein
MIAIKISTFAAIAACAVALPLSASIKNPVKRPIRLQGQCVVVVNPSSGAYEFTEVGQATHTGRYINTGTGLIDPATGLFASGSGTAVAANGDTLNWIIPCPGRGEITGGTGKFQGITGGWDVTEGFQGPPVFNDDGTITVVMAYVAIGEATY